MDDKIVQAAKRDPAVAKTIQTGQVTPVDEAFAQQHLLRWEWSAKGRLPTQKLARIRKAVPEEFAAVVAIPRLAPDEPDAGAIAIRPNGQLMLYLDRPYTTVQWEMRGDPEHDGIRFRADSGGSRFISYKTLSAAAKMPTIATPTGGVSAAIMGANAFSKIDLKNVHPGHEARLTLALNALESSPVIFLGGNSAGIELDINNGQPNNPVRVVAPWYLLQQNLRHFPANGFGMHFGPDSAAGLGQGNYLYVRDDKGEKECEIYRNEPTYSAAIIVTDGVNEFAGPAKVVNLGTGTHYHIDKDGMEHPTLFKAEVRAIQNLEKTIELMKKQAKTSPPPMRREGRGP